MVHADNRLTEIARIGKAHGLKGFIRLFPETEKIDIFRLENQIFYLQNRRGDLIPARIETIRVESKRNMRSFFVKFDQITDRSQAETFQDTRIFIDRSTVSIDLSNEPRHENITGFLVNDDSGVNGIVKNVVESPAHFIIEIDSEAGPLMIPWVDAFVRSVDTENRILYCRGLDQFLEL